MTGWEGWPCNCFMGFGALRSLLNKSKGVFACRPSIETWARWAFFLEISRVQVGEGPSVSLLPVVFAIKKWGNMEKHEGQAGTDLRGFSHQHLNVLISFTANGYTCKKFFESVVLHGDWFAHAYYQATCNSELQPKEEFLRKHRYQDGLSMDLPLLRCFAVRLMDVSAPSAPMFDGSCRSWQCHASNGISCRRRFPASIPSTSWPKSVVGDDPGKVPIPRGYSWFQGKVEETCCQSKGDIILGTRFLFWFVTIIYTAYHIQHMITVSLHGSDKANSYFHSAKWQALPSPFWCVNREPQEVMLHRHTWHFHSICTTFPEHDFLERNNCAIIKCFILMLSYPLRSHQILRNPLHRRETRNHSK